MAVLIAVDPQGSCPRSDTCALSTELGMSQEAGAAQIHQGGAKIPSSSSGRTGKVLGSVEILKDWLGEGSKSHPSSEVCTQEFSSGDEGLEFGMGSVFPGVSQCKAQLRGHWGLFLLGLLLGGSWEAGPALVDPGLEMGWISRILSCSHPGLFVWEWLDHCRTFALSLFVISLQTEGRTTNPVGF